MIPIKFNEPEVVMFNPLHVKSAKVVKGEYNSNWCVVIEFTDHKIHTVLASSEEQAYKTYDYINDCLSSIM